MKFLIFFTFCFFIQINAKSIPDNVPNLDDNSPSFVNAKLIPNNIPDIEDNHPIVNESTNQTKNHKNSLHSFVMGLFDMTTRFIEKDATFKELNAKFERINSELIPKIKNLTDDIVNSKIDLKTAANDFVSNISNEFKSRQSFRFKRSISNNRWSNSDAIRNFFERIIQSVKDTHVINDMSNFHDINNFYRAK